MGDKQISFHFQVIQQQFAALQRGEVGNWEEMEVVLEDLRVICEQMQTSLDAAAVVEEELLQQTQQLTECYHRYHDLFQSSPIAYLVTDANGIILEANDAIAQLLNMPQRYLPGNPLTVYIAEADSPAGELRSTRLDFRTRLNELTETEGIQVWQITLSPRGGTPLEVELVVAIVRSSSGSVKELRIGVHPISQIQQQAIPLAQPQNLEPVRAAETLRRLPQSLDGLRVLVVDDEADVREFITALLESCGTSVRAVASTTAALEALTQFRPDVLLSDIRMPGGDGYSLIRQIRTLEAEQGGHLPAAALTAYLDGDREKALQAGYEAYLHKLAQPGEWVKTIAQLANQP